MRTPSFGLFMQEMNLLPLSESQVTRQEKMATVWDEAEVSAGRPEGRPKVWAVGLDVLGGGKGGGWKSRSGLDWAQSFLRRGQNSVHFVLLLG